MGFEQIDPLLILQSVAEQSVKGRATTQRIAGRDGLAVSRINREQLDIVVTFGVAESKSDMSRITLGERMEILRKVNTWCAAGGKLTTSYRPGYWIYVLPTILATAGDPRKWSEKLALTLTGFWPYWQTEAYISKVITGDSVSTTWTPNGIMGGEPVEFVVTPSGTLTQFAVTVNGETMTFAGLSETATITLAYTECDHLQTVTKTGGTSMLRYRTAGSADELYLRQGSNSIAFSANVSCAVTIRARGMQP